MISNFEWEIKYSYKQAQQIWDSNKVEDSCEWSIFRRRLIIIMCDRVLPKVMNPF